MLKSFDYREGYILLVGTVAAVKEGTITAYRNNKQVIFKNCTPFY